MKKLCLFILAFFSCSIVFCQAMNLQDPVSRTVFNLDKYAEIKGSPFLEEKWIKGSATISRGTYMNLDLKVDLYNNTVLFAKDDLPYEFQDDVISFVLMPKVADSSTYQYYKKGFSGNGLRKDQYLQVLVEGGIGLYRSDIKLMSEISEVNRGVIKAFNTSTRYFIMKDGNLQLIKLTKKDVLDLLSDEQEKVEKYADQQKLSFKKEADVARIVKYYLSL